MSYIMNNTNKNLTDFASSFRFSFSERNTWLSQLPGYLCKLKETNHILQQGTQIFSSQMLAHCCKWPKQQQIRMQLFTEPRKPEKTIVSSVLATSASDLVPFHMAIIFLIISNQCLS